MDEINTIEECGVTDEVTGQPAPLADNKPVILEIPVENIGVSEFWVRRDWQEELDSLAESIDAEGLQQFPAVRETGDGTYTIIFGHRRYLAYKESGRKTIPCRVLDVAAEDAAILLLIENLHRRQLHPVDEARTIRRIADAFNLKDVELARRIKRKPNVVNERLAILALPDEILEKIGADPDGCFMFTHALTLSRLWDGERPDRQTQVHKLFEKTIEHGLSTIELKDLVALLKEGDFERLPGGLVESLLSNKWMTAAMARLFLRPYEAVVGKDSRAKAMRAAARKLSSDQLEKLIMTAVAAGWTYENTREKLLKMLGKRLDATSSQDNKQRSDVGRLLACVSSLEQQLDASQKEIEELAKSNPKGLEVVWLAICQLQERLRPIAALVSEAVNSMDPDGIVEEEETASVAGEDSCPPL